MIAPSEESVERVADLRRQRQLLNAVVNSLPECVIVVDAAAHIAFVNLAAEQLLGMNAGELLNRHFDSVVHLQQEDGHRLLMSTLR